MKLRSRIDLNLLAVFDAIYSRGSVTQAARHLNLSQSAISHALSRLRREFDDELFVRTGNTLVATALARSMVDPISSALRSMELAVAAASHFDPTTTTRLFRVGLRQSTEARVFGGLVALAMANAPHVRLSSVDFRRGELTRSLAYGDIDAAIDIQGEWAAELCAETLQADSLVVVARRDHPVIRDRLDLDAYLAADHVVASPRPAGYGAEDEALAAMGRARHIRMRCQHIWTAWQIVFQSDMILTLPQSQVDTLRSVSDLLQWPLPIDLPPRTLQLYWHPAVDRDPGHDWLRTIIRTLFQQAQGHEYLA